MRFLMKDHLPVIALSIEQCVTKLKLLSLENEVFYST